MMDEDLLHNLMGGGLFGGLGMGMRMGGGRRRRQKGENTVHQLRVTLEDLYNGKTRQLELKKKVICCTCEGAGGKSGAVRECTTCHGTGVKVSIHQIGPGMVQQMQGQCPECDGEGEIINERDRCKTCLGKKVVEEVKRLEVVIERGMSAGKKIVFRGEGNQMPGVEPGDIIIVLDQLPHKTFERHGDNLIFKHEISLTEALCGFRFVLDHLDGRQLAVSSAEGEVIEPSSVRMLANEGMPLPRTPDEKGSLYVKFEVAFPENNFKGEQQLKLLEPFLPARPIFVMPTGEHVEEVDLMEMDSMPSGSQRMDESDDGHGPQMQCATH